MNAWFDLKEAGSGDEKQIHQKRNDIRKQNNGALADFCLIQNQSWFHLIYLGGRRI